ncbi:MAG: hypothetical protein A2665_02545 [Candidatus Zambryskibacteria bacterium RIFCSPHIGHO2_01_FULL_46_30]|uniref:Uncharacterized protein n=1 Tax=Candidatus Zambryskibacteria bacterium RIFCSPHIGHO2_01_FULL_46_30 TaxID=1802739 RepID=A0A1G2SZX9_9BACT|nr:MAG: hypothetical protein A2665_02545 [Candidatus Zambryskibacteria bacterium RIFCSPHIGHO2_01_FULL_46_30]OHB06684.1 MAG: hypothetical protein A3B22_01045 [Candidatus Zambryskibacteria bacterium RIFCSPLOWO2_01_FULL_47_33]
MKTVKREIHALDYMLCVLISLLDRIFRRRLDWWDISQGLNVEILDRQADVSRRDVLVRILPVGWAEDEWIAVRCMHERRGWVPFKGAVYSHRLPDRFPRIFNFETHWPIRIEGRGDEEKRYITEAVPEWAKLNR